MKPHVCLIRCDTTKNSPVCKPEPSADTPCSSTSISSILPSTADTCGEACKGSWPKGEEHPSLDKVCRFWRFEKGSTWTTCTFFSKDQCKNPESCTGSCKCGDEGCYVHGSDDPEAPVKDCAGGVNFNRGGEWIHWACINFERPDISSPYHP